MSSNHTAPPFGATARDSGVTGSAAALAAFGIWALFPIYFHQFGPNVSPWEILLHRVIWSAVCLVGLVLISRRLDRLLAVAKRPRTMMALTGSALAVSGNWAMFIWAVTHGEILQSSLGYYINPLLNVFLGYYFLKERLQPLQGLAVAIAAGGVALSLIGYGHVPWLALLMAGSFALYGLIRKQIDIDSITGLTLETILLLPASAGWLILMHVNGDAVFLRAGLRTDLLLVGAGILTSMPLIFFTAAVRRLRLATLGIMQYIAPTGHFLIGVYLYGESFDAADAVTFGCIWTGLLIYTVDIWLRTRSRSR